MRESTAGLWLQLAGSKQLEPWLLPTSRSSGSTARSRRRPSRRRPGSRPGSCFASCNAATGSGCRTRARCRASAGAATNLRIVDEAAVVIGEVFSKKTPATPQHIIDVCRRRFRDYDAAIRDEEH